MCFLQNGCSGKRPFCCGGPLEGQISHNEQKVPQWPFCLLKAGLLFKWSRGWWEGMCKHFCCFCGFFCRPDKSLGVEAICVGKWRSMKGFVPPSSAIGPPESGLLPVLLPLETEGELLLPHLLVPVTYHHIVRCISGCQANA